MVWLHQSPGKASLLLSVCLFVFFLLSVISPPALMDDVDSVTAQIARTMVESGDWVTPRLNGVAYFEKPALRFWLVAVSYLLFGVHDWAARLPLACSAVLLCGLVLGLGRWAFPAGNKDAGALSGLVLATCVGLFLFTRILLPDVVMTLTTTLAMWSFLRALEEDEARARLWAACFAVSLGLGFMLKGLVAFVLPVGAGLVYLLITKQLWCRATWQRLRPLSCLVLVLLICAPWLVLSILRNPPYFDFTMQSEPGQYHGFFWFFFLNEHLFRYLNLRYPRDYNTVPRAAFWLYHGLWLFPWSAYLPFIFINSRKIKPRRNEEHEEGKASGRERGNQRQRERANARGYALSSPLSLLFSFSPSLRVLSALRGAVLSNYKLNFQPLDRAGRTRLLCLCWIGFTLLFFTFSTTQEYYSMPCYPAFALLLGSALAADHPRHKWATRTVGIVAGGAALACLYALWQVREISPDGDIASVMQHNVHTLSLGKVENITFTALAWLRLPLAVAAGGLLLGALGAWWKKGKLAVPAFALMMLIFFSAARLAMVTLSPYFGSRALAEALVAASPGQLIVDDQYYTFSSVFFYANRSALLLNGRKMNLEYGSYAPDAPNVFITDQDLPGIWHQTERKYLMALAGELPRLRAILGTERLVVWREIGGKVLLTNQPLTLQPTIAQEQGTQEQ